MAFHFFVGVLFADGGRITLNIFDFVFDHIPEIRKKQIGVFSEYFAFAVTVNGRFVFFGARRIGVHDVREFVNEHGLQLFLR